jgi:hypothetical protein
LAIVASFPAADCAVMGVHTAHHQYIGCERGGLASSPSLPRSGVRHNETRCTRAHRHGTQRTEGLAIGTAWKRTERSVAESGRNAPLNFRADAALSYARAGAHRDAERLIREFDRGTAGRHVSPGLAAMARLAVRDYANARKLLEHAIDTRARGMDPMPLLLIQRNSWADPVLEEPEWQSLRARLGGSN